MPESIKQLVVSAFADHDPLLLSALAISIYGGGIRHN